MFFALVALGIMRSDDEKPKFIRRRIVKHDHSLRTPYHVSRRRVHKEEDNGYGISGTYGSGGWSATGSYSGESKSGHSYGVDVTKSSGSGWGATASYGQQTKDGSWGVSVSRDGRGTSYGAKAEFRF